MLGMIALALALAQTPAPEGAMPPPAPPTPYPPAPPPAVATPYPAEPAPPPGTPGAAAAGQPPSPLAAFVPDQGFRIRDESGDYMLRVGLQSAYRVEPVWTDGESQMRNAIAFLRPILRGNIYKPWITFWTSLDLSGNPIYLLDSYFDVAPVEEFGLRAGQQYSPYDRQEQLGPQQLFFPEFAPVADYFWPGRDKGVQAYGMLWDKHLEYYAAGFSGTPLRQTSTIPGNWVAEARLAINPMGPTNVVEFPFTAEGKPLPTRVSFSLEGYGGRAETALQNFNDTNGKLTTTPSGARHKEIDGGGDVWFQTGPLILTGDAHFRRIDPLDGSPLYNQVGSWGQAILNVWANRIAVGAQVDWIDPNTSVAGDEALIIEGEVAWFIHAPDLVLKLRYANINQQRPSAADVTLPYPSGVSNLVTLQFNLSF